jgi:DNA-dependent RNA polymerase auxiliary subunit epsilon
VTLVNEKLDKKDHMMLEQQAGGIQAKTAAEPRRSSNAGTYVDGDTSNRVRVFSAVDLTPGDTWHRKACQKDCMMLEQQAGIQAKTATEPRKSSNEGPYVNGDTSNRVRVFATVDTTPGDTRHRKAGQKGPYDA